ncbi:MAG: PorP/SprF family type IX secretion system membrane protein [Crocinitomicaceae bacterium]|nr:PorP/SprF family type IX secretion system membrane protein [Crocinitomicaceae bacterium]
MKKTSIIILLLFVFIGGNSKAQDVHFSQFLEAPLLQNPSFAGTSSGDYRALVNYRTQWGSVSSNPFETFGANFDMRFKKSQTGNFLAGGISVYTDVAGESKMRSTLANVAAAYHLKINDKSYFSTAIQGGINQKSINKDDLRFDNQFDGIGHNSGVNSNENLGSLSELKPTVSAGVSYLWSNSLMRATAGNKEKKVLVGFAVHHFNSPSFQFSNEDRLGLKYVTSIEGSFASNANSWSVQPAAFLAIQNKAVDLVFGSLFKYTLNDASQITDFRNSASLAFGAYYRLNDAIIPTVQLQLSSFNLGVSYDVNLSKLSGASDGRGGFEISLKYISQKGFSGRKSRARYS